MLPPSCLERVCMDADIQSMNNTLCKGGKLAELLIAIHTHFIESKRGVIAIDGFDGAWYEI